MMEQVSIWYLTDNEHGEKLSESIRGLGLSVNLLKTRNFDEANVIQDEINIFIIDMIDINPETLINEMLNWHKLAGFLKFVILPKKDINNILKVSINLLHLEFITRPVDRREFLLLIEKSIIVERYRELMTNISQETETRIENYEGLMDINRKKIFSTDTEKQAFQKILHYEKGLIREQRKLNDAIKEFSIMRQKDLIDMKNRIHAEEMLADLRHKEMIDAKEVIEAQESVIDFSTVKLEETKQILNASEQVAELSRSEAIDLHKRLEYEKIVNKNLSEEIEKLLLEVEELKKR